MVNGDPQATSEIRIAVVLNGGVSLAVWMSGVVIELHHLALAAQDVGTWDPYRRVLRDVLRATARIDVIAGTSAGGLNGAFLALGQVRQHDLALMRDLWVSNGGLDRLLRPADEKSPPSLLRGDDYFLVCLQEALRAIASDQASIEGRAGANVPPVELYLTGTLWSGRESTFTDDMGVAITERDYDATFAFASHVPEPQKNSPGDLENENTDAIVRQLAIASRCTSSFPGAFEPHYVERAADGAERAAGGAAENRWPTSAGQANFGEAQYVLDGGILLNKPIRPALEAIYRQPGGIQIRRVLAYIVPDPGEPPPAGAGGKQRAVPNAGTVLMGVMTRLRSTDSVARELSEIRDRNATVRARKQARARLSSALAGGAAAALVPALWDDYRAERISSSAATIGRQIAAGQRSAGDGAWSEREITDALCRQAATRGFPFVPQPSLPEALAATGGGWRWGQTTVLRLMDVTTDLFHRGLRIAGPGSGHQEDLITAQGSLQQTIADIRADRRELDALWYGAAREPGDPIPVRKGMLDPGGHNSSASNIRDLEEWLVPVIGRWENQFAGATAPASQAPSLGAAASPGAGKGQQTAPAGDARREQQHQRALSLAAALFGCKPAFAALLADPGHATSASDLDVTYLRNLYDWLLEPAGSKEDVLARMLELDVVLVAINGTLATVEQEVELVQMSGSDPGSITGRQLHHFGAFYRPSWRVNDWIEGRLDGARQIMRLVLAPDRLRQLGYTAQTLLAALEPIAVPPDDPASPVNDHDVLLRKWQNEKAANESELQEALARGAQQAGEGTGLDTRLVTALDGVAGALARPLQLQILREDLAALAGAIRNEEDAMPASSAWLRSYDALARKHGGSGSSRFPAEDAWSLLDQMRAIGRQKIMDDVGSDTFARTVAQAAAVGSGVIGDPPRIGKLRAVQFVLSALRGYTAMLWAMVSYLSRGGFGAAAVGMAVAIGGTLLAVTILVPGVPVGISLAGAGLVLAGASAAALLTPQGRGLGWRLLAATLLVAGVFGYLVWQDIDQHGFKGTVVTTLIKVVVGALILLLGWFLATFGRRGKPVSPQEAAPAPPPAGKNA